MYYLIESMDCDALEILSGSDYGDLMTELLEETAIAFGSYQDCCDAAKAFYGIDVEDDEERVA